MLLRPVSISEISLPTNSKSELNDSRNACYCGNISERCCIAQAGARIAKVVAVKDIEELSTQLKGRFFFDPKIFK